MSRPLRIEYEGAWYHVMNRGAERKSIFASDEHRLMFLELLKESALIYQIEIHAYCLMDNHYHLLIRTPYANLGRAMRHLNGVYTQRFNRLENRDGALLRGRYKAILIEENNYLLQVSRYIHLNPVEANICYKPEQHQWSSYSYYLQHDPQMSWLKTNTIISEFGGIEGYVEYIASGIDEETNQFYHQKYQPAILATSDFIKNKMTLVSLRTNDEINPDIKRTKLRPSIEIIIEEVAIFFKIAESEITKPLRGEKNIPRLVAIHLSRTMGMFTYSQIGNNFDRTTYAVRTALRRFEKKLEDDAQLRKQLKSLKKRIDNNL